jgi:hypothetical protein
MSYEPASVQFYQLYITFFFKPALCIVNHSFYSVLGDIFPCLMHYLFSNIGKITTSVNFTIWFRLFCCEKCVAVKNNGF